MSLTFNTDGEFAGQTIRVSPDKYASIYDIMKVAGVGSTSTNAWNDIKSKFFENRTTSEEPQMIKTYKFQGRGQRDTPVINGQGLVKLLFLLPGVKARRFVAESSEILVRYLGGDESLIDEIRRNREIATMQPNSTQAFMAGNAAQLTNSNDDLVLCERRCRLERDLEEVKKLRLENLKDYERYALEKISDPRVQELVNNEIVNQILTGLNPGRMKSAMIENREQTMDQTSLVTIDQVASQEMVLHLTTKQKSKIGRQVASIFREQYPDQEPLTVEKFVNGEMRHVKAYPRTFMDTIKEQIVHVVP